MLGTKRFPGFLATLFFMLACGCASDRPPSGGPADTTPLTVVLSSPAPSEINVSSRNIRLKFNHFFTGRQLVRALAFSPQVGPFDVTVDGKNAEITFMDPLRSNTTYILSIDKNLRDYRGRSFSEPFSIAFSTGPAINTGTIQGTVCSEDYSPAGNALVLAYAADREPGDTRALLRSAPDYMTQTNASGVFSFRNLAPGLYRMFAVNDRNGDMRYSGPAEEIGLTAAPSIENGASGVSLILSTLPDVQGMLASCRAIDREHIAIRIKEPVNPEVFGTMLPEVREAATGKPLQVISWYGKHISIPEDEFILTTGMMKHGRLYRAGITSSDGIEFSGSGARPQALTFTGTVFPENGSDPAFLDYMLPSEGNCVVIRFSLPADAEAVGRAVILRDADSGKALQCRVTSLDPRTYIIKPLEGFRAGNSYKVTAAMETVFPNLPKKGNLAPLESTFAASLPDDAGSLTGSCRAPGPFVIVEARAAGSHSAIYRTRALRERDGVLRFTFNGLPPGRYTVMAFMPRTEKEPDLWRPIFPGSIDPFRPPDPFSVYRPEVQVRARWTTEHIDISITK
jgi:uncharacterized protein (DUF2141 family)